MHRRFLLRIASVSVVDTADPRSSLSRGHRSARDGVVVCSFSHTEPMFLAVPEYQSWSSKGWDAEGNLSRHLEQLGLGRVQADFYALEFAEPASFLRLFLASVEGFD